MSPVDPGPRPPAQGDRPPVARSEPGPIAPGAAVSRARSADVGGWRSTLNQGLVLSRWTAGEVVAQRIEGFAWIAWVSGAIGLGLFALSLPVDPGWPLITLGVVMVLGGVLGRLTLALAAGLVRRLALPRKARHLRSELAAARGRVTDAVADAGIPVTVGAALRFVVALALGRKPHQGVATKLKDLALHLDEVAEVHRFRQALDQAVAPSRGSTGPPPAR